MPQPPRIDNRRDILLLLLYSPGVSDGVNEPVVGRTRLVKMLFLFRQEVLSEFRKGTEINEDNFYEFFAWSYGPFSSAVYDDLNFFSLRGFIEVSDSEEDTLPQSLEEWEHWLSGSSGGMADDDIVDYAEQEFRLTPKGCNWTQPLFESLNTSQKATLRTFKKQFNRTPLRAILRYVYETYPEYTDRSEIRTTVLGSE